MTTKVSRKKAKRSRYSGSNLHEVLYVINVEIGKLISKLEHQYGFSNCSN